MMNYRIYIYISLYKHIVCCLKRWDMPRVPSFNVNVHLSGGRRWICWILRPGARVVCLYRDMYVYLHICNICDPYIYYDIYVWYIYIHIYV